MDRLTENPARMAVGLAVPETIVRNYFEAGVEKTLTVPKGSSNGEIVLQISAVPV